MTIKIAVATFTTQQIPKSEGTIPSGYMTWLTKADTTVEMKNIGVDIGVDDRTVECVITESGVCTTHVVRMDANGGC